MASWQRAKGILHSRHMGQEQYQSIITFLMGKQGSEGGGGWGRSSVVKD